VKDREHSSTIYTVDVLDNGVFGDSGEAKVTATNKREYWRNTLLPDREAGVRVRARFIDKMSGPVLQMLGARYNIEPFFFSSSINWIPSRYQENVVPNTSDHITVTLTFVRSTGVDQITTWNACNASMRSGSTRSHLGSSFLAVWPHLKNSFAQFDHIDTHAPLILRSQNKILLLDLLAIHMVRDVKGSTIISYHHSIDGSTTAKDLFTRLKLVGRSVYWQIIVRKSKDPTFVFLAILWSALYAWDEALETLYEHFCWLESRVIVTNDVAMTYELHVIRAHLLHYTTLLLDFKKSVVFVRDTPNPVMDHDSVTKTQRKLDKKLLVQECGNLLLEIERLEMNRRLQDDRVQNVKLLVYAMVNIEDSKAMKRLSYITMIFLPGSFVAGVFGMNIIEFEQGTRGTLAHYFEATLPLTLITIWLIVAYQSRFVLRDDEAMWKKLLWPIALVHRIISRPRRQEEPSPYLPI